MATSSFPLPREKSTSKTTPLISHKKEFLEILVDKSSGWRKKMLADLGDSIKEYMLADPDMWPSVRKVFKPFLEAIWQDIEKEVERGITASVHHAAEFDEIPGPSVCCLCIPWLKFRAYVLHHYLPHDKSIFGKLKDPFYLVLYVLSFLPVHGVRVAMFGIILFMLLWPGQPDEFQLINFILLFKGFQFLTSGLLVMAYGAFSYYSCYTWSKHELLDCMDNHGPAPTTQGATLGLLLDYSGSIILVWIAFAALSHSVNSVQELQHKMLGEQDLSEESDKERMRRVRLERTLKKDASQGGRLRALLVWDRRCFFFSVVLLMASLFTCVDFWESGEPFYNIFSDAQFRTNVYWCCDVYAVLSIPFALFCIPGLMEILTHSDYTGFNSHGACVYWDYIPKSEAAVGEEAERSESSTLDSKLEGLAHVGVKIVRTIERGQVYRGAEGNAEYKFGDFTRGLIASYFPSSAKSSTDKSSTETVVAPTEKSSTEIAALEPDASEDPASPAPLPTWMQKIKDSFVGEDSTSPAQTLYGEPFHVAEVSIPRVQEGHPTYFFVKVTPYANFGEQADPWHVKRRYNDFKELRQVLGRNSNFKDAPFPDRQALHFGKLTGEELEARRSKLELWLSQVIQDPSVQDKWATPLRKFLQAPLPLDEENPEVPTAQPIEAEADAAEDEAHASETVASVGESSGALTEQRKALARKLWQEQEDASCASLAAVQDDGKAAIQDDGKQSIVDQTPLEQIESRDTGEGAERRSQWTSLAAVQDDGGASPVDKVPMRQVESWLATADSSPVPIPDDGKAQRFRIATQSSDGTQAETSEESPAGKGTITSL